MKCNRDENGKSRGLKGGKIKKNALRAVTRPGMEESVRRTSSRSQQRLLRGEVLSLTLKNRKGGDSSHGLFVPP